MRDLLGQAWATPECVAALHPAQPRFLGLESVMKFFGSRPRCPSARNAWRTKIASVGEGDLVVGVAKFDNRVPGTNATWFDMWRIQDSKTDEHWDYGSSPPVRQVTDLRPGQVWTPDPRSVMNRTP
jgi:hypothetical protein